MLHHPNNQPLTMTATDVDEWAEIHAPHWDLYYEQLSSGQFEARKEMRHDGQGVIYRESVNQEVRIAGELREDSIAFGIFNEAGMSGSFWGNTLPSNGLAYLTDLGDVDVTYKSGTFGILAIVPRSAFLQFFTATDGLNVRPLETPNCVVEVSETSHKRLAQILNSLLDEPRNGASHRHFTSVIITEVCEALRSPEHRFIEPSSRRSLFQRAVDLADVGDHPLSIPEICLKLTVSPRTLENAFQSQVGISPRRYLNLRRMNKAYVLLKRGNPEHNSVTQIATSCGFTELGRFAVNFRKHFGISPSERLRNRGNSH
ncbi:helix-turn-helix transcriptional regulator [Haloferula chungangensis]|uniref:Helix-turn-helix transcriptional regulator n=1 Tax=Haloferula chungangensis TaxID=1048331 RepID=A0ABW2L5E3_9BACT